MLNLKKQANKKHTQLINIYSSFLNFEFCELIIYIASDCFIKYFIDLLTNMHFTDLII